MNTEPLEPRRLLAATPLNSGQQNASTIGVVGEIDEYTIEVTAAQPVLLVAIGETATTTNFSAVVDVVSPTGSRVATKSFGGTGAIEVAPASGPSGSDFLPGTYTLRVHDVGNDATGSYRLTAFTPGVAQFDDEGSDNITDTTDSESAVSGRRYAATAEPGDLDVWRIDATVGQALSVTVSENDAGAAIDPQYWLITSDGHIAATARDNAGSRSEITASRTGSYYAIVADGNSDATGIYALTFTRVPGAQYTGDADTGPLAPNTQRAGDLPTGDADVFSTYVDSGATLTVTIDRGSSGSLDPYVEVRGPSGKLVGKNSITSADSGHVSLAVTGTVGGTYTFAVYDAESDDGGTYTIQYALSASGTGNAPAEGDVHVDTTNNSESIQVIRATTDGVDTLSIVVGQQVLKQYYAPEITQLSLNTLGGNDKVTMSESNIPTYVSAGDGDDTVIGSRANDTLTGGSGRNRLYGGDGEDRLNGGNSHDILFGEGGDDRVYGNGGDDQLDGGGNADRLYGGLGSDQLVGGTGNDKLYGNEDNDTLTGGKGEDRFDGGAGDDTFHARDSAIDELFGGGGNDSIVFSDYDRDTVQDLFPASNIVGGN